ncbi:MAG: hypothetical protein GY807_20560 [Gammaproteobacteria bacterium]|nr:hypothetical protein [Gammaproteobacteria bacterium]
MMTDKADDVVKQGREAFEKCRDAENHNRTTALEDIKFAKLAEQWPSQIKESRRKSKRPCLTINKLPAFIRQVVNDSRQNKPSIKVRPVDSGADIKTADIISGLIRNIEYTSSADVAYDTAIECAVAGGFGYIRVGMDYSFDDAFDMDISIDRVLNPFSVYGDPHSTSPDGSDWDVGFVVDRLSKNQFEKKYKGKANVDFDSDAWSDVGEDWLNDEGVLVAEWWTREEVEREICLLSDGRVFGKDQLETDPDITLGVQTGVLEVVDNRTAKSYQVKQVIMSGVDVLEENDWPGRFIPIVPVYGDEFSVQGKRYFRSLINPAKDAQRMFNYWRTTSTELVALAPRVPWIGPKGAFDSDIERWQSANVENHSFLEYDDKGAPPQRQPLDTGVAAGALQEALNASDDMKAIIGLYDASLGARSNETSGVAINARQREGDISTFHFIDNLSRAIRHVGKIVIDLIPHVYDSARVVRVIGEDDKEEAVQINQPVQAQDDDGNPMQQQVGVDDQGNPIMEPVMAIHDLTAGKYDLTVETGPSYTTRRAEAADQMIELLRAFPAAAPVIGDLLAKNLDWPGADEISRRLEKMNPANQQGIPPEIMQQMEAGYKRIQELEAELKTLKGDQSVDVANTQIKQFDAETKRMKVQSDIGMDLLNKAMEPTTEPVEFPGQ